MRHGFSLVELSIVLAVIGLLIGGVLTGQALLHSSELRSISTDATRYLTAIQAFETKYDAIPGDMKNAVQYWGAQAGGTATGYDATCAALTTVSVDARTCNGNGNGMMDSASTITTGYEMHRAWQHLVNAGLISGSFSGVTNSASDGNAVLYGLNAPATKIQNTGFALSRWGTFSQTPSRFSLILGGGTGSNGGRSAALNPEEAWGMDTKMDDGAPATGAVVSTANSDSIAPGCTTTDLISTAVYDRTKTAALCPLYFLNAPYF